MLKICINKDMNPFSFYGGQLSEENISPRSAASREWFLDKIKNISERDFDQNTLMKQPPLVSSGNPLSGKMYMFWYNPKGKKTLPYYDAFPLIILLDVGRDHMTGLNLHYLPIRLRQNLFYGMLNKVSSTQFNSRTYMKITYDYLKSSSDLGAFRPCFKRYLTKQIKGRIVNVPAQEWEVAVHLPTSSFRKKDSGYIYRESRKQIGNF
jgi:hypothetical protein